MSVAIYPSDVVTAIMPNWNTSTGRGWHDVAIHTAETKVSEHAIDADLVALWPKLTGSYEYSQRIFESGLLPGEVYLESVSCKISGSVSGEEGSGATEATPSEVTEAERGELTRQPRTRHVNSL